MLLRFASPLLLSAIVAALAGCGSFEDDMRTVCNAPNEVKLEPSDDPSQRATKLAKHIEERIRTDEVKQLFSSLATMPPAERRPVLEKAAKRAGIDECPFLDAVYGPPPSGP